ncbi:MAG: sigma-70 family RNA polymerase sigma factor [Labilithrix sp.]|nr:sigma-70 family RNA polymerase sigma factor [Labilithrix sp.]
MDCVAAIGGIEARGGGDSAARDAQFRAAIEPLVQVAFRVLQRLGVRNDEIDDALQAVLIAADRKFDALQVRAELRAYTCAVCVNVAREIGRTRNRHAVRSTTLEDLEEAPLSSDADPADALERKQTLAMIQQILEGMIPERREVFVLYELEELSGREIAEHLGVPAGTVASRLRKARVDFREALARAEANDPPIGREPR